MAKETTQVEAIEMIATAIEEVGYNLNPQNAYGNTLSEELYNIGFQFSRIADALEKIASK
jgi:hypothetical protein